MNFIYSYQHCQEQPPKDEGLIMGVEVTMIFIDNSWHLQMIDDISFIPDSISIMSKVKQPLLLPENSLSRIIRQQPLLLSHQDIIPDQDITFHHQPRTHHKKPFEKSPPTSSDRVKDLEKGTKTRAFEKKQVSPILTYKGSPQRLKYERKYQNRSPEEQIRSTERKVNLLVFDDIESPPKPSPSKKEKRPTKKTLDEQKTKKIEFQDLDRYSARDPASKKRQQPTKIKQNHEQLSIPDNMRCRQGVLELISKQSSDMQSEEKGVEVLQYYAKTNFSILSQQIKEILAMTKWEYIEMEKVELRKMISKAETDIRKIKIGFRGLSQSYQSLGKSKLKGSVKSSSKLVKKVEDRFSRQKVRQNQYKMAPEYGLEQVDHESSRSFLMQSTLKDKKQQLQQQIKRQKKKQQKLRAQLSELTSKYNYLKQNKGSSYNTDSHSNPTPSTINRVKILKDKAAFLKTQIKQTQQYYSHRIKRIKNQNSLIQDETKYTNLELERLRKCLRNIQKNNRKYQQKSDTQRYINQAIKSDDNISSNRNILSLEAKSMKSINSLKSLQQVPSFNSKPSVGSINSIKSIKSNPTAEDAKPQKNKLKIASSHAPAVPAINSATKLSTITKRKRQTEMKLGLIAAERKKVSSLDAAFHKLQQKYEVHLHQDYQEHEYYN